MDIKRLAEELNSDDNLVNRLADKIVNGQHRLGRKLSGTNVPPIFREVMAINSRLGAKQVDVAKQFGVTQGLVHNFEHGRVNTKAVIRERGESQSDITLRDNLDKALGKVRDAALDRIIKSLEYMEDDKLESQDARVLSQISSNLSRVVAATMPKNDNSQIGAQFNTLIYAPEPRKEADYEVVEVG
jgi:predicted transcriptional regulator